MRICFPPVLCCALDPALVPPPPPLISLTSWSPLLHGQVEAARRELDSRLLATTEERDALREEAARLAADMDAMRRKVPYTHL